MKLGYNIGQHMPALCLSIPSAGRTGMKLCGVTTLPEPYMLTFNTLSGSYRDEAQVQSALQALSSILSIPSAGRTGMKLKEVAKRFIQVTHFQYPQRVVPG